ncbi:GNAT family N-acetyltransferase [Peptoniphilus sp. KCTC 25270]|uniref:GNAT family N-acetyltransferase n=1 Tax=Peptoniphilus sp. KCTC 25270 TaxID=2897414 RepID=UPI001E3EB2D1|nr:GNAT family N-acetyltransferase [Peptoniphilus sp. KCTC 25270]MCD1147515.1 GNAT family N-acetyltransferase [Peptoniphilus sp. KCTC 25270]
MNIRKAKENDIPKMEKIIKIAKEMMASQGNTVQWQGNYPSKKDFLEDMEKESSYVVEEKGEVVGMFALIIGEEKTYRKIYEGNWRWEEEYGTIHRIASNGKVKSFGKICFDFAKKQIPYLRIDTHEKNTSMRKAVEKYGFKECGIIYVENGSPRIAYDYKGNGNE